MSDSYLWGYSDFIGSCSNVCTMKDPSNKVLTLFSFFQVVHNLKSVLVFLLQCWSSCLPFKASWFPKCLNGRPRKADNTGSVHNTFLSITLYFNCLSFLFFISECILQAWLPCSENSLILQGNYRNVDRWKTLANSILDESSRNPNEDIVAIFS